VSSRFGPSAEKIDALNDYAKSPLFSDISHYARQAGGIDL
jgi:hypothetical protein